MCRILYRLVLYFIIYEINEKTVQARSSLKAVAMLTRHGDRAPGFEYLKDPYRNHSWPGGKGALSPKGSKQMFKSGQIKAKRYEPLLQGGNNILDITNILVRSSIVKRCVDSAKSFLDGFLPGTWSLNLVNVVPREEDEFLIIHGKTCPKYGHTVNDCYQIHKRELSEIITLPGGVDEFIDYVEMNTGLSFQNKTSLLPIYFLEDTLSIQLSSGLPLPSWAQNVYEPFIIPLIKMIFNKRGSSKFMKIRSGVLLNEIIKNFNKFIKEESSKNVIIYFAHDLTENGLTQLLDIIDQTENKPDFGAMLVMELHENSLVENDFEIKIFYYRNHSVEEPIKIGMSNCEEPCSFRKFKNLFNSKLVLNYSEICNEGDNRSKV